MSRPAGTSRPLWPYLIPVLVIVVALMGTVFFPFVNRSQLWFGLPSVGLWSVLWVLVIAPALALVEHLGGYGRRDDVRNAAQDDALASAPVDVLEDPAVRREERP